MKRLRDIIKLPNNYYSLRQETKDRFLELAGINYIKPLFGLIAALIILNLFFSYKISQWSSQDLLILHYNVTTGIDLIGPENRLFIFPILGFLILAINTALAMVIKKERKFLSYFLVLAALTCNLILLISLGLVYIINFR